MNYSTRKVPLLSVLKNPDFILPRLTHAVEKSQEVIQKALEFLQLYLLKKLEKYPSWEDEQEYKNNLPPLTLLLLRQACNLVSSQDPRGRPSQVNEELKRFHQENFAPYNELVPKNYLNCTLNISQQEILENLEVNLRTHFFSYLYKFINVLWRNPLKDAVKELKISSKEKMNRYRKIDKQIKKVKEAIVKRNSDFAPTKYQDDVEKIFFWLFPFKITVSLPYHLKAHPQDFLLPALLLNREIAGLGAKAYQVIPQRKSYLPHHITLDTAAILEVLHDHQQKIFAYPYGQMSKGIKKYQKHIWKQILKVEKKLFHPTSKTALPGSPNYVFHHQIKTDGISVSLLLIKEEFQNKRRKQVLPEEESKPIQRLEEMSQKDCQKYQDKKLLGIDPGKKNLLTISDENQKHYHYSQARRQRENYNKRSQEILLQEKKKHRIIYKETSLAKFSAREYTVESLKAYLRKKAKIHEKLKDFYQRVIWRKLALRRYISQQQAEANLLNEIMSYYGITDPEEVLMGLGNWSNRVNTQLPGCSSSLNKGLHRLLSSRFPVVEADEHKTSQIYFKDQKSKLTNLVLRNRKIHSLLTLPGNPKLVIVNRDHNAASQIQRVLKTWIEKQERPVALRRSTAAKE